MKCENNTMVDEKTGLILTMCQDGWFYSNPENVIISKVCYNPKTKIRYDLGSDGIFYPDLFVMDEEADEEEEILSSYVEVLLDWLKDNLMLKYRWLTSFGGFNQLMQLNQIAIEREMELKKNSELTEEMVGNQILAELKDNLF